jgi:hypothetical protein
VVTAGDLLLLDIDDQRVSAFRADDIEICWFNSLGAEARIGEKYLFVYNIKVKDVKRSLCAGVSKPASREKQTGSEGLLAEGVFWSTR